MLVVRFIFASLSKIFILNTVIIYVIFYYDLTCLNHKIFVPGRKSNALM